MTRKNMHVVFYDGVCHLCDRTVQFLLRMDRDRVLSFAPLQGEAAKHLNKGSPSTDMKTMLFVENYGTGDERVSSRSTGILRMLAHLGGVWRILSWFRIVPAPLRDVLYRVVAHYRYVWFGRFDTCRLPSADESERFLD